MRGSAVREVVGGKGNNVARALTAAGPRARPVTFFGGTDRRPLRALCCERDDGLDPIVVPDRSPDARRS